MPATTGTGGTGGTPPTSGGTAIGTGGAAAGTAAAVSTSGAAATGAGGGTTSGTGAGLGAASAVRPCKRLVTGTGGTGAGGGAGTGGASAEAAVCRASGTADGVAAKFCTMSRQGTPGLTAGSAVAVAVALSTRTGHIRPTVAMAARVRRFVVRDMVFPEFVDGTATDRSFTVLLKLLKKKL